MKAVALFSGGLDSVLAIKLIQSQGIKVVAVSFTSPFFISQEKQEKMKQAAKQNGFKLVFIPLGTDYLRLVRRPKHGHGKNMNPCIDCHAFMAKKAKKYASKIGAKFVFTGEVLDERPMSQNKKSLETVAKESGLKDKLLRPLSAKRLPLTEAEKKGFVDRDKLLGLQGRGRKKQFALAKKFKIKSFETPAGGCLLTTEGYSKKLKDLFDHKKIVSFNDVELLRVGRHFRFGKNKIIVGRNKEDNERLSLMKKKSDYTFEAKGHMGPTTILQGSKTAKAIILAAELTASYCDAEKEEVVIEYQKKDIVAKKKRHDKHMII